MIQPMLRPVAFFTVSSRSRRLRGTFPWITTSESFAIRRYGSTSFNKSLTFLFNLVYSGAWWPDGLEEWMADRGADERRMR